MSSRSSENSASTSGISHVTKLGRFRHRSTATEVMSGQPRMRTLRQVTQPSSFSNSVIATGTTR